MDPAASMIDSEAERLAGPGESPASGGWSDWLGVVASIGCAIHCAAMPFVIAYLPALGLSFLADEAFHKWMAVGCFAIALAAFVPGYRKHGRFTPVAVAAVGLVVISVAAFGFAGECCPSCDADAAAVTESASTGCTDASCKLCESAAASASGSDTSSSSASDSSPSWVRWVVPWLTPLGGLTLVSAHLLNRRYGSLCGCCGTAHSDEATG